MKIPIIAGIFLAGILVFPGCASGPRRVDFKTPVQTRMKPLQPFQIQDYQTKEAGEKIPEWVNRYLAEGVRGVESAPEFRDKYVFIGTSEGPNFNALRQWEEAFSPAQDFARLVASRIETRLSAVTQNSISDDIFGRFSAALIKKASDAQYQGAVKETGFWIQQLFPPNEGDGENENGEGTGINREVYDFLVLISIDRDLLESQVSEIFNAAKTNILSKRDQVAAINRIRDNFFEGF